MGLAVLHGSEENPIQVAFKLPSEPANLMTVVNAINPKWYALYGGLHAPDNLIDTNQVSNTRIYFKAHGTRTEVRGETKETVSYILGKKWPNYVQFDQAQDREKRGIGELVTLSSQLVGLGYRGRLRAITREDTAQINMCFDLEPAEDKILISYHNHRSCPRKVKNLCETLKMQEVSPEDFYKRFNPEILP